MSIRFPTGTEDERTAAVDAAAGAIRKGELVIIPTDTVYGIACDAFDHVAVQALLDAKGRGREMPPPVLISSTTTADALAVDLPEYARELMLHYWPGPLTIVAHQQVSLRWDLGETRGTVAIRMPDDETALQILERTGPLAVSSANTTGRPAATTADEAESMLGDDVTVVVDGGPSLGKHASTIVDVTGPTGRILRRGALQLDQLNAVLVDLDAEVVDPG